MIKCSDCGFESIIDETDGSKGHIDFEQCFDCWLKYKVNENEF